MKEAASDRNDKGYFDLSEESSRRGEEAATNGARQVESVERTNENCDAESGGDPPDTYDHNGNHKM